MPFVYMGGLAYLWLAGRRHASPVSIERLIIYAHARVSGVACLTLVKLFERSSTMTVVSIGRPNGEDEAMCGELGRKSPSYCC